METDIREWRALHDDFRHAAREYRDLRHFLMFVPKSRATMLADAKGPPFVSAPTGATWRYWIQPPDWPSWWPRDRFPLVGLCGETGRVARNAMGQREALMFSGRCYWMGSVERPDWHIQADEAVRTWRELADRASGYLPTAIARTGSLLTDDGAIDLSGNTGPVPPDWELVPHRLGAPRQLGFPIDASRCFAWPGGGFQSVGELSTTEPWCSFLESGPFSGIGVFSASADAVGAIIDALGQATEQPSHGASELAAAARPPSADARRAELVQAAAALSALEDLTACLLAATAPFKKRDPDSIDARDWPDLGPEWFKWAELEQIEGGGAPRPRSAWTGSVDASRLDRLAEAYRAWIVAVRGAKKAVREAGKWTDADSEPPMSRWTHRVNLVLGKLLEVFPPRRVGREVRGLVGRGTLPELPPLQGRLAVVRREVTALIDQPDVSTPPPPVQTNLNGAAAGTANGTPDIESRLPTRDDVVILKALANAGRAMTQTDLEAATRDLKRPLSRKTIGTRLAVMREDRWVDHPEGKQREEVITALGRQVLGAVSPQDTR